MSTYIYWIHYPEHTDPQTEGYIGISSEPSKRFKYHSHPDYNNNSRLFRCIRKGAVMSILAEYTEREDAFAREEELRPTAHIGWNMIPGGDSKLPVHHGNQFAKGNNKPRHSDEHKAAMSKRFSALKWYTNGEENKRLPENEQPEGWWRGVTSRRCK